MSDLRGIKVGDKLVVSRSHYDKGRIELVQRVTPTGLVVTATGTFNLNGWMRGGSTWNMTSARPATDDDIAGIYRDGLVNKLKQFDWNKLNAEDLKAAYEIISRKAAL